MIKITVVGAGYVGMSIATLLAQQNEVVLVDIAADKIDKINNKISPIKDDLIEDYLLNYDLHLKATLDLNEALQNSLFVVIAAPTNYDPDTHRFDTTAVDAIIKNVIDYSKDALVIVKSTIPIGYIQNKRVQFKTNNLIFSPEFLREGKALYDNLHPSRIIVGDNGQKAHDFANLLKNAALNKDIPVLFVSSSEAESIKLFANTYLALRVAFFNELDTYAEANELDSKKIIDGIGLDPRIGSHYNNPSFGYGGYCLPKDAKQLLADYRGIPQELISAVVKSNETRKIHIVNQICLRNPSKIGIYHLAMKNGSDNFRESSIIDVMFLLRDRGIDVIVYEPILKENIYDEFVVINNFDEFKKNSDIIIANRFTSQLNSVKEKVYTRDLFGED